MKFTTKNFTSPENGKRQSPPMRTTPLVQIHFGADVIAFAKMQDNQSVASLVQEIIIQTSGEVSAIFVPADAGAMLRAFDIDKRKNSRRYVIKPVDTDGSRLIHAAEEGKEQDSSRMGSRKVADSCRECVAIERPVHVPDIAIARMANWLLITNGLCVGPRSAAVAAAFSFMAWRRADDIPNWGTQVLVFPDSGEAYLNTILNDDWLIAHGWGKAVGGP